ncbi:MAG: hypothetical protein HY716_14510 [Planctomycetes bacterium]|nr:hypothetical protein [Planctomycetota bacterium]
MDATPRNPGADADLAQKLEERIDVVSNASTVNDLCDKIREASGLSCPVEEAGALKEAPPTFAFKQVKLSNPS